LSINAANEAASLAISKVVLGYQGFRCIERVLTMPYATVPPVVRNPVTFTFLITVALAAAVLIGASISGVASGALQDLLRTVRSDRNGGPTAEQRRQGQILKQIEASVDRARADVALLNARVNETENHYREAAAKAAPVNPPSANPAQTEAARANSLQNSPEFDLGALRASLDDHVTQNENEFRAVNKRIDWLEKRVSRPGGASQPVTPVRRPNSQLVRRWHGLHARRNGSDAARGAMRQHRFGRWATAENGTAIRER
jgi:hypothetical protein